MKFFQKQYTDSQNMISLADSKANISLTIQGLLVSITLGLIDDILKFPIID